MIGYSYPVETTRAETSLGWQDESDLERLVLGTNCCVEEAARHRWEDPVTGRRVARGVLKQFAETAGALEARGWSADRMKQRLEPSRQVFATSSGLGDFFLPYRGIRTSAKYPVFGNRHFH